MATTEDMAGRGQEKYCLNVQYSALPARCYPSSGGGSSLAMLLCLRASRTEARGRGLCRAASSAARAPISPMAVQSLPANEPSI